MTTLAIAPISETIAGLDDDLQRRVDRIQQQQLTFVAKIDYRDLVEQPLELESLNQATLLTIDHEAQLFRQMNLAFRDAVELRDSLVEDPLIVCEQQVEEVERLIERGQRIRNVLAVVFRKLAISISGSFAGSKRPIDELISEANATMLYAISKFNPDYGFRFTTYLTHAVRRQLLRYLRKANSEQEVNVDWQGCLIADDRRWSHQYERKMNRAIGEIDQLLRELGPRERYVIRSRFGWGREFEPRTLQSIAEDLGISRERVRQLESRALAKMRQAAEVAGYEG